MSRTGATDSAPAARRPAASRGRGTGTALGWRSHSGWAVAVVVAGGPEPTILWRERVELAGGTLPRQPYHAVADVGMSPSQGARLIARVEKAATTRATAAIARLVEAHGVKAVGIVGGQRAIPEELERVLASHAFLHAAEGDLYEQALAEAAGANGLPALLVPPRSIEIPAAIEQAGKILGPPWQKDHKLAASVGVLALGGSRRR